MSNHAKCFDKNKKKRDDCHSQFFSGDTLNETWIYSGNRHQISGKRGLQVAASWRALRWNELGVSEKKEKKKCTLSKGKEGTNH